MIQIVLNVRNVFFFKEPVPGTVYINTSSIIIGVLFIGGTDLFVLLSLSVVFALC